MIKVSETKDRKVTFKDLYFDEYGVLLMAEKDAQPSKVDLDFYLKSYFGSGDTFGITISSKVETSPDPEPVDVDADDEY